MLLVLDRPQIRFEVPGPGQGIPSQPVVDCEGPKGHINTRILHPCSSFQYKGGSNDDVL